MDEFKTGDKVRINISKLKRLKKVLSKEEFTKLLNGINITMYYDIFKKPEYGIINIFEYGTNPSYYVSNSDNYWGFYIKPELLRRIHKI